jgi:hypothetical protein
LGVEVEELRRLITPPMFPFDRGTPEVTFARRDCSQRGFSRRVSSRELFRGDVLSFLLDRKRGGTFFIPKAIPGGKGVFDI